MIVVMFAAALVASLLDPIALVLCLGIGFLFKSYWKGAFVGALAHLFLVLLLLSGAHIGAMIALSKLSAGAIAGAVGAAIGKWVSTKKPSTPDQPES